MHGNSGHNVKDSSIYYKKGHSLKVLLIIASISMAVFQKIITFSTKLNELRSVCISVRVVFSLLIC